ncbi:MAG: Omp28 family outer membrane lipoprotein [Bacteroidales bacterium]
MMRKVFPLSTLFLSAATLLILSSCDKIEPPYIEDPTFTAGDTTRNVVLEKYTGHLCPNCPEGAKQARQLKDIYGENLILISVHAGFFSRTEPAPYDYDFTTPAGDALDNHFDFQSYPMGLVSRTHSAGQYKRNISEWSFYVDSLLHQAPDIIMELSANYNNSNRELTIDVFGTVLENIEGDYNLAVVITEDSIIRAQRNNNPQMGPTPDIPDYVHMHVFRAAVNGTWGENYFSGPKNSGDQLVDKQYSLTLDSKWKAKNCHIIAYIYRNDNNEGNEYEIIQAIKTPLL